MSAGSQILLDKRLVQAARRLAEAGVEDAPREARRLAQLALRVGPGELFARKIGLLTSAEDAALNRLIVRRAARVPFARLAGEREFWSLSFRLVAATLEPRPETETLVEAALARTDDRDAALRVLDLGTGSGCLLLALLSELPRAIGLGVDVDRGALDCARANAERLGYAERATWRQADWATGLEGPFDVVLANPPYVAEGDWETLEPEVRDHDPKQALVAGPSGLDAYLRIIPEIARLLAPEGFACLEIGAGQARAIGREAAKAGLGVVEIRRDLAQIERCVVLATAR